ncbi:MAG: DedA family protein [Thermoflexales bacterium]|nr:DedA family protein [Thermoflexales bacterium]MCS7324765.1 DedA family protein [Thermoflexales bacterium]MCX7939351.1 DedA family protein [Thermoflexales bacterium]MDW8053089.1 DedA family protein [Anaerolineae bacterium]MDW8291742.1 DedA family protein [Anaerolineae bacterium]
MLEQLAKLIEQIMLGLGYVGIALVMFIENVFPPIPSEVVMPLAGFLAGEGKFEFVSVWIAGTLGSVLGAVVLYYIGFWVNHAVLLRFIKRYGRWIGVSTHDIHRALSVFDRYGEVIVFVGRLIPLIRSLISIPAGMHRMHFARFLAFTAGGSAIWSGVLAYAGMLLGQNWRIVVEFLKTYQNFTMATLGVGFVALAAVFVVRRMRPALAEGRVTRSAPLADK